MTLSAKFVDRVDRLLAVQLQERRGTLTAEIEASKSLHNSRGMLMSGAYIKAIQDLCIRELEIRGRHSWQALVRVIGLLEPKAHPHSGPALKDYLNATLKSTYNELEVVFKQSLFGNEDVSTEPLQTALMHVTRKHEVEIDLFLDAEETNAESSPPGARMTANYNFYGNVGSVQSGDGAVANVVQNLAPGDREALERALRLAREAIESAPGIASQKRTELVAVIDEAAESIRSEAPNNTKLESLFSVISSTVQSLASAPGAYVALKAALLPLGITLP